VEHVVIHLECIQLQANINGAYTASLAGHARHLEGDLLGRQHHALRDVWHLQEGRKAGGSRSMVVLAAAVCTKTGKVLISRQFVEMSRVRIEGLLAAFPKLMGSEKQHTFIETESVRYVYQPMETLYILLVTNNLSNIIEDLDTLQILAKIVPEYCKSLDEEEVLANAFQLVFSFDEVISLGYKEKVTLQQIKTFTEMDSHEEKIHEMMERNKIREAMEEAKRKAHQIERIKADQIKTGQSKFTGMGGGGAMGLSSAGTSSPVSGSSQFSQPERTPEPYVVKTPQERQQQLGRGMDLRKGGKTQDYLNQLVAEGELDKEALQPTKPQSQNLQQPFSVSSSQVKKEGVHFVIEEKIVVAVERDGTLQNFKITGDLIIHIHDPNSTKVKIKLNPNFNKTLFKLDVHSNFDKALFAKSNVLTLKDQSRSFPASTSVSVLKWRAIIKDESLLPFTLNCWPAAGSGETTVVNLDYELNDQSRDFKNLTVAIHIPGGHAPVVNNSSEGSSEYDNKQSILRWKIPVVDSSNPSGSLEFTIPYTGETSLLYPIELSFSSNTTFVGINIAEVVLADGEKPVTFSQEAQVSTESYQIK